MKKLLFAVLIAVLIVSCSKDNPEEIYEDPIVEEYGLQNKFEHMGNVNRAEFNDSLIFFAGKLKDSDNIGLVIYHKQTKKKLFDLIPFDGNTVVIDMLYGEKAVINVDYITGVSLNSSGNTTVLSVSNSFTVRHLFIRDNKILRVYDSDNSGVTMWNQNFIISNGYLYEINLFNPLGEIITKVYHTSADIILNDYEGILIDINYVEKIDLRKEHPLWTIYMVEDLNLNQPRLDDKKLLERTNTHFTYEISYTERSGTKGTIKIKVNIETGEIEYL